MARLGAVWSDNLWNVAIWDTGIWEAPSPPTVVTAVIDFAGQNINLNFTNVVQFGAGGNGGFTLTMSGGAVTMTYVQGAGTRILTYSLSRTVATDETGTLDYTQPGDGIEDLNLTDVESFVDLDVSVGAESRHNRIMRHTDPTLTFNETDLYHKDPTIEHNE